MRVAICSITRATWRDRGYFLDGALGKKNAPPHSLVGDRNVVARFFFAAAVINGGCRIVAAGSFSIQCPAEEMARLNGSAALRSQSLTLFRIFRSVLALPEAQT
jgi:hypothetical protein